MLNFMCFCHVEKLKQEMTFTTANASTTSESGVRGQVAAWDAIVDWVCIDVWGTNYLSFVISSASNTFFKEFVFPMIEL